MLQLPRTLLRGSINRVRAIAGADPIDEKASLRGELKQAGQIVVIFALMLTVLIGLIGIAIDTTYAWRESLRVQRAADAAALAGVVYMPGALTTAQSEATASAKQNGFPLAGTYNTTISATAAPDPRELDVSLSTQVPTFFSRIFGINYFPVTRSSKAIYVTPVPMGSPLAYYGVYQLCPVSGACIAQPSPTGMTVASQGFYGGISGEGSNNTNGDAFATYFTNRDTSSTPNSQYKSDGYRYGIVGGTTSGTAYLFDPMFCATISKTGAGSGGHAGAGDHWLGPASTAPTATNPPSTYYILWDTHNLPLAPAVWTIAAEDDETGASQFAVDKSSTYGNGGSATYTSYSDGTAPPSSVADCSTNAHHNKWVTLGAVSAGETYSLQITTTKPGSIPTNQNESFQNNFSIAVSGTGARVYGNGSMETYANIDSGSQEFYLAQIDRTAGAGKTVEIDLWDPGDTSAAAWLQIEPDSTSSASAWQPTTFSYTADNGRSNASTNCIQTHGGSGSAPPGCSETSSTNSSFYNGAWVTIRVALPTSYGDPSLVNSGWWKIKYIVNGGNDTTTWEVSIRGNPVHLI